MTAQKYFYLKKKCFSKNPFPGLPPKFSSLPKKLNCPNVGGGGLQPPSPPGLYAYAQHNTEMDMGRVHPWIGSGWVAIFVFLWVGSDPNVKFQFFFLP